MESCPLNGFYSPAQRARFLAAVSVRASVRQFAGEPDVAQRSALNYAAARVDHCPHMETKTFCSACKTHCYKPQMREAIRQVMRWSGPRMIFHHPVLAIRHLIETKKQSK